MKLELIDILKDRLLGERIRLYEVNDTQYNPEGNRYFITDKGYLAHPKRCSIVGESIGLIKDIEAIDGGYDGDIYTFIIFDDNNIKLNVMGLDSITNILEII